MLKDGDWISGWTAARNLEKSGKWRIVCTDQGKCQVERVLSEWTAAELADYNRRLAAGATVAPVPPHVPDPGAAAPTPPAELEPLEVVGELPKDPAYPKQYIITDVVVPPQGDGVRQEIEAAYPGLFAGLERFGLGAAVACERDGSAKLVFTPSGLPDAPPEPEPYDTTPPPPPADGATEPAPAATDDATPED